jgi:hypothetical protein
MATRLKTVEFGMPPLAAMTDNTLTSLTQITVYLPESSKVFRSAIAVCSAMGTATAQGNITTRQLQCRLGAAGYTTHTNSNLYTGSGEDIFCFHSVDLTAHFTTNWSGNSMSFDAQVLYDGTATGIAWTNVCVTLYVTYEYDDTSATQIKTVRFPIDMPLGNIGTSKPGSATMTLPQLSTVLTEGSRVYRNKFITVQGNVNVGAATDVTFSMQLDATASITTGIFEGVGATDYWLRYIWDCPNLDPATAMGFYFWGNTAASLCHMQAWLTVTYEFDATAANDCFVSLMIPMEIDSPLGASSSDWSRGSIDLYIPEPATIVTKSIAFYFFWDAGGAMTGLNMRIGSGSFVAYATDRAVTQAGSVGAMIRNDSAYSLARGKNSLVYDVYRTGTSHMGWNTSGFWLINYTCGKPTQGYGAANHTVAYYGGTNFEGTSGQARQPAAAPVIPETAYFLNSLGARVTYYSNTTNTPIGLNFSIERLTAEGGQQWQQVYGSSGHTLSETGLHTVYPRFDKMFLRFPGDQGPRRVDLETSRRYRMAWGLGSNVWGALDLLFTYHAITWTVADSVSGFSGTVTIDLHRASDGEKLLTTSRSGDGAFSFTWYDNTENVFISANDGTHVGRSTAGLAA